MKKKLYHGRIFYGWYIVAAAFIIMAVGWGITFNTASLFIKPISEELGFSRQEINATFTIRSACQMIISLFSGIIFTKLKIRNLMKVASITLSLSIFSYSFVESLGMLYFITAISSVSIILLGILPLSLILNNWFYERCGFVIGLAFMGSGVGGMIFSSLIGNWLISFGWRTTYKILGIIVFLAIVPCVFLLIKIRPKEVGLAPLGESSYTDMKDFEQQEIEKEGTMLSEAIKTLRFWSICICGLIVTTSSNTLMHNISPYLTDIGYTVTFSANVVALSMGSLAVGKLILGYLFDKLGLRKGITILCLSTLLGLIGMIFAEYYIALAVVIICVGLSSSYHTIAIPIITYSVYGRRNYSSILGIITAANSLGGIIGPILVGYIYDLSGSYIISYKITAIATFSVMLIYQFVLPKKIIA